MRLRVAKEDVEHYARAHRDGQPVRLQGQSWRVLGVTVETMAIGAGKVTGVGTQNISGTQSQWWVELIEVMTNEQKGIAVGELVRRIGLGPVGVRIDDWDDRSTWQVSPNEEHITPAQRAASRAVIDAYDPEAFVAAEETRRAGIRADAATRKIIELTRYKSAEEIDAWLSKNVRNVAQARKVLGAIIKSMAVPPM